MTRAYQDAATFPYLSLLALNPIIVIAATLTGAITIVTGRLTPMQSMLFGTLVGGVAPFWMGAGPYLTPIVLYVLFTSIGEIVWSPVAYSYLMSLTKDGDEGAYFALAGMPTFLAKLLTGGLTGGLMSVYCPERRDTADPAGVATLPPPPPHFGGTLGVCNAMAIWGIIGLSTCSSFVLLLLLRHFVAAKPPAAATIALSASEVDDNELMDLASESKSTVVGTTTEDAEDDFQ